MIYHELDILSISITQAIEILVPLIIVYNLVIYYEYKIGEINPFQRLTDDIILKPISDDALIVHLAVLIERRTCQLKEETGNQ